MLHDRDTIRRIREAVGNGRLGPVNTKSMIPG
jgi:hypothetical protein